METSSKGNLLQITDLARTLRREQLFIQNEQHAFSHLNETINNHSTLLTKLGYVCAHQRQNLNELFYTRPKSGLTFYSRRAHIYDNLNFVEARKIFKYEHVLAYEDLFNYMYARPQLLAVSIATCDLVSTISLQHLCTVLDTISTSLYGNIINTGDLEIILKLLTELFRIQVVVNKQPPSMMCADSSAFARLYQRLCESIFSGKVFLTTVLYQPLMGVLSSSNEFVLDTEPNKVINNTISINEILKYFCMNTTQGLKPNINCDKEIDVKLYTLTKSFIESLAVNWSLFPSSLRWLVQNMFNQLKQTNYSDKIINEFITDMVFTNFICPAIVNPDIMGIIDAPISDAIRFSLKKIAEVIQILALSRYADELEKKIVEVHGKFDVNFVANLIDLLLLEQPSEDIPIISQQCHFERIHFLCTQRELQSFTDFFRILSCHENYIISIEEREKLKKILSHIPISEDIHTTETLLPRNCSTISKEKDSTSNGKENRSKQTLMNLGKITKNKIAKSMSFNITSNGSTEQMTRIWPLDPSVESSSAVSTSNTPSTNCFNNNNNGNHPSMPNNQTSSSSSDFDKSESQPVLIFNKYHSQKYILQPLTEEEFLKIDRIDCEISDNANLLVSSKDSCIKHKINESSNAKCCDEITGRQDVLRSKRGKVTSCLLSRDDPSIENSDNLEAISEAHSNYSVTSLLELGEEPDQNDNLSDIVSANVSGRVTPNVSGRDTPSSQVTDGESVHNVMPTPQMQKLLSKERSDIEDKFCKFEIKKFEGDENVSIISDTWSTDVLASDSETLDANERDRDRNFATPLIPSAVVLPIDNNFINTLAQTGSNVRSIDGYLDSSDQHSESNWSTDVLASYSGKLAELDTDENVSIFAKSDITDIAADAEKEHDLVEPRKQPHFRSDILVSCFGYNKSNDVPNIGSSVVNKGERQGSIRNDNNNSNDSPNFDSSVVNKGERKDNSDGNAIGRSQEDSLGNATIPTAAGQHLDSYIKHSSLSRSSIATTNQLSGENSFQQNYKSGDNSVNEPNKQSFLIASRMCSQISGESSISNQSLNIEDENTLTVAILNEPRDLIDLSICKEEIITSSDNIDNLAQRNLDNTLKNNDYANVEHRRLSCEQRTTSEDGRRNGILAFKSESKDIVNRFQRSLQHHQGLSNENQEISQTGDDKQEQLALSTKTEKLRVYNNINNIHDSININNKLNVSVISGDTLRINRTNYIPTGLNSTTVETSLSAMTSIITTQKPLKSTGAIPKSISFDASADKSSIMMRSMNTQRSQPIHDVTCNAGSGVQTGIFNKLKYGIFKSRRNNKGHHDAIAASNEYTPYGDSNSRNGFLVTNGAYCHISEEILEKYRRKVSLSYEETNSDSTGTCVATGSIPESKVKIPETDESLKINMLLYDKANPFNNAKKKIHTVLSKMNLQSGDFKQTTYVNISPLQTYMQIQLAEAINLRNFQQIPYVSEAIRCISKLQPNQHAQLVVELKNDMQKRDTYLQYLMCYRQNILLVKEKLEQLEARLKNESDICNRYLMNVSIHLFLEKNQHKIESFQADFACLSMSDDKINLIEEFVTGLVAELQFNSRILIISQRQAKEARNAVERILLQLMYHQIMFPNDDADLLRDSVLADHISKLQSIIYPSHPSLCIPKEYLAEAPWDFAQQQISYITAYKTPREKLQCVIRSISSIMSLLQMSSCRAPAADDVLPVVIFVVIMANPPNLLSTIEYITCFLGDKLDGPAQFYWTLFCSVVKFIKTMDYLE